MKIEDINDNSPRFPKKLIKLEIGESIGTGARFRLEEAHDADEGQNGIQNYSLEKNEHFSLSIHSNTNGGKYCELVLQKELDREQKKDMDLVLIAIDGGTPLKSGTAVIHVIVLDANDNIPVFTQPFYKVSILENSPLDTMVVKVSAVDADEGVNGHGISQISDKASSLFSIDKTSGEIQVIRPIDFEDKNNYEIRIQAKDGSGLASNAKVEINIIDLNDNTPVIHLKSNDNLKWLLLMFRIKTQGITKRFIVLFKKMSPLS